MPDGTLPQREKSGAEGEEGVVVERGSEPEGGTPHCHMLSQRCGVLGWNQQCH